VNLHRDGHFYRPARRHRIVIEAGAFPSIGTRLPANPWPFDPARSLIDSRLHGHRSFDERSWNGCCQTGRGSGAGAGQACSTSRARHSTSIGWPPRRNAGAVCGLDLAHSIGNLPLRHQTLAPTSPSGAAKCLNSGRCLGGAFVHARHAATTCRGLQAGGVTIHRRSS
jgi:kynureninase